MATYQAVSQRKISANIFQNMEKSSIFSLSASSIFPLASLLMITLILPSRLSREWMINKSKEGKSSVLWLEFVLPEVKLHQKKGDGNVSNVEKKGILLGNAKTKKLKRRAEEITGMEEIEGANLPGTKARTEGGTGHLKKRKLRKSLQEEEENQAQGQLKEESTEDTRDQDHHPLPLIHRLPLQREGTGPKTEREETEAVQVQTETTEEGESK